MFNPKWTLWINRAINKHFNLEGVKFWIEEEDINHATDSEYVEVRVNGPHLKERSKDYHTATVEVNLMIGVKLTDNRYRIHELTGLCQELFETICVIDDSNNIIGYLILRDDVERPIDVIKWGRLSPDSDFSSVSIDGYYRIEF